MAVRWAPAPTREYLAAFPHDVKRYAVQSRLDASLSDAVAHPISYIRDIDIPPGHRASSVLAGTPVIVALISTRSYRWPRVEKATSTS